MTPEYVTGFATACRDSGVPRAAVEPLLKLAAGSQGLSDRQVAALDEMIRRQNEDRDREARQRKARFARNRQDQLRESRLKWALGLGLGGGALGAWTGSGTAAGLPLMVGGGALGALGGYMLGTHLGNARADKMEDIEDETGVSVVQQSADRDANRAKNLAAMNLLRRR